MILRIETLRAALAAAILAGFALAPPLLGQSPGAEAEVRAVIDAFRTGLGAGDGDAALAQLHPDVRVFEGGHAETRDEYASGHLGADMAFLQAVESTTTSERLVVDGAMALYLRTYTNKGEFRGRQIDASGTETLVLSKTDDGWRILHIHWST